MVVLWCCFVAASVDCPVVVADLLWCCAGLMFCVFAVSLLVCWLAVWLCCWSVVMLVSCAVVVLLWWCCVVELLV